MCGNASDKERKICDQDICKICSLGALFQPDKDGVTPIEKAFGIDLKKEMFEWYKVETDEQIVVNPESSKKKSKYKVPT